MRAAVVVARSNARWAMVWPTGRCGPNSGHGRVYFRARGGDWTYRFYDMDTSLCHKVPASVRRDFTAGYMC